MNYQESIQWLYSQIPHYQKIGNQAYKPGLKTIGKLMEFYGNSHRNFRSIHVAGTNGKGSVSHSVASILQESGYKVGLFTSPHLIHFTERIRINGEECSRNFIHKNILKIKESSLRFSFFELTTAFAFEYFFEQKVDFAIIEVGLGGRLDATNIITPEICAITSIDFDHQDLLGNTLIKIASEKAGIIKCNVPVVIGEKRATLIEYFSQVAKKNNSKLIVPNYPFLETDLKGNYQIQNQNTTLGIIYELELRGVKIKKNSVKKGLKNIIKNTSLRGRWEILSNQPLIICDTAHNPAGIKLVFKQLIDLKLPMFCLLGFVRGKSINEIISLLPRKSYYVFTQPTVLRGLNPEEYENILLKNNLNYVIIRNIYSAFFEIKRYVEPKNVLFIGGSSFVVADVLEKFYEKIL